MAKFKFRLPKKLTRKQERAIDSMKPILLTGVPGAGKTVVATMRLRNSKNGILFTYGKLLSKAISTQVKDSTKEVINIDQWYTNITDKYLKDDLIDENLEEIIGIFKRQNIYFKEVIIDEGQDITPNTYKLLKELTDKMSVGADEAQMISYDNRGSSEKQIASILGTSVKKIVLDENFRNSYAIFNFSKQFVPDNPKANDENMLEKLMKESGEIPIIYKVDGFDKALKVTEKIINANPTDNIGILCKNISKVSEYANALADNYEISVYHNKLKTPDRLNNILVTTIHSAKGMEFDIVVLADFHNIYSDERNLFFVGSTRAKTELYLLCEESVPKIVNEFDKDTYTFIEYKG